MFTSFAKNGDEIVIKIPIKSVVTQQAAILRQTEIPKSILNTSNSTNFIKPTLIKVTRTTYDPDQIGNRQEPIRNLL